MKYKVGDKVRVRKDLTEGREKWQIYVNDAMADKAGEMVEIKRVTPENYRIVQDSNAWTEDLFEGLEGKKIGKKRGPKSRRIVVWDTSCGDPFKVFDHEKDAMKFIEELIKDGTDEGGEEVIKESIKLYHVSKVEQVKISFDLEVSK